MQAGEATVEETLSEGRASFFTESAHTVPNALDKQGKATIVCPHFISIDDGSMVL
jgi:hypothetical protein